MDFLILRQAIDTYHGVFKVLTRSFMKALLKFDTYVKEITGIGRTRRISFFQAIKEAVSIFSHNSWII